MEGRPVQYLLLHVLSMEHEGGKAFKQSIQEQIRMALASRHVLKSSGPRAFQGSADHPLRQGGSGGDTGHALPSRVAHHTPHFVVAAEWANRF